MPREKELFRDNLEIVLDRFEQKQLIPILDVAEFLGVTARHLREDSKFPKKVIGGRYYVAATALARFLS